VFDELQDGPSKFANSPAALVDRKLDSTAYSLAPRISDARPGSTRRTYSSNFERVDRPVSRPDRMRSCNTRRCGAYAGRSWLPIRNRVRPTFVRSATRLIERSAERYSTIPWGPNLLAESGLAVEAEYASDVSGAPRPNPGSDHRRVAHTWLNVPAWGRARHLMWVEPDRLDG
jgi:hypothetical protein